MWVQTSGFSLGFCTVLLLDVWNTPTISDSKGPEVLLFLSDAFFVFAFVLVYLLAGFEINIYF